MCGLRLKRLLQDFAIPMQACNDLSVLVGDYEGRHDVVGPASLSESVKELVEAVSLSGRNGNRGVVKG